MIKKGLVEEVEQLKKKYNHRCPPFKSVGYKEILMYLNGSDLCFEDAVDLIKQHSRNFAKRQLSWFKQETDIRWFESEAYDEVENYVLERLRV